MKKNLHRRREPAGTALVLFFVLLFAGALLGRLYAAVFSEQAREQVRLRLTYASCENTAYFKLLREVFICNAVVFFSILLAALCTIGPWYYMLRIGRRALLTGFLAGELAGIRGASGIWLTLAFYMPAWLVYTPVSICVYRIGFDIWSKIFRGEMPAGTGLTQYVPYKRKLGILFLFLAFGVILEVFIGTLFLRIAAMKYLDAI